jgi:hypothetical protein
MHPEGPSLSSGSTQTWGTIPLRWETSPVGVLRAGATDETRLSHERRVTSPAPAQLYRDSTLYDSVDSLYTFHNDSTIQIIHTHSITPETFSARIKVMVLESVVGVNPKRQQIVSKRCFNSFHIILRNKIL